MGLLLPETYVPPSHHYTIEEFAELVRSTPPTVRRWIATGELSAINVSRTKLAPKNRLAECLR